MSKIHAMQRKQFRKKLQIQPTRNIGKKSKQSNSLGGTRKEVQNLPLMEGKKQ